jgi:branched-subunit amino acid transport protein
MTGWLAVGLLGAVSYALRSVVVFGLGDRALPPALERFVGLLAPAVLAAMVAGSLAKAIIAAPPGTGAFGVAPAVAARVAAVLVGGAVAMRTGSVGRALGAGVLTYVVLARLLGG